LTSDERNGVDKDQIRSIVLEHVTDVVEGLEDVEIDPSRPIVEYGAESLDILEVVGSSARDVGVKVAREELMGLKSIDDLVDLYHAKLTGSPQGA
jgi:acyl carrier protein